MSAADPFEALGVAARFDLSASELRGRWMRAAAAAHPDATGDSADAGARVNAAYQELSDPLRRASALLRRHRAPVVPDPGLPPAFLIEAMELREAVDAAAGDGARLAEIRSEVAARHAAALEAIAESFRRIEGAPDSGAVSRISSEMNIARALARIVEQIDRETAP